MNRLHRIIACLLSRWRAYKSPVKQIRAPSLDKPTMDNENHLFPNGSFKFFIPIDTFSNTKEHCSRFPHCNGTTRRVVPLHFIHIVTKYGSEKSESHDLETHRNWTRDRTGKQARILTITSDGRIPQSDSVVLIEPGDRVPVVTEDKSKKQCQSNSLILQLDKTCEKICGTSVKHKVDTCL